MSRLGSAIVLQTNTDSRWIVAQEGSRQTYAIPVSFQRLNLLRLCYVDIWCRRGRSLLRRGPQGARALATRYHADLPPDRVVSFSSHAILTRSLDHFRRWHISTSQLGDIYNQFGHWFAKRIKDHLRTVDLEPERDHFFGFNSNCLEVLELLKARRILTVVDQVDPGKVEEDLVSEEAERWPGWALVEGRMPASYWDRLKAEWDLANLVLVNSLWLADALVRQGVPRRKIIIVPLALDIRNNQQLRPVNPKGDLKVLWLGSVILRKGIQYLIEAARMLESQKIEFLLAGPLGVSEQAIRRFPPNVKLLGRVTRDRLRDVYAQAHLFVLPTISDGFAITQLEAMSHGLPVITTPNCGQVVTHGLNGFIVPVRDSAALAEAIATLNDDRHLLLEMSLRALHAVKSYNLPSNALMIESLVRYQEELKTSQPVSAND